MGFRLLLSVLVVSALLACNSAPSNLESFENDICSVSYPTNWELDDTVIRDDISFTITSPMVGGYDKFSENFNLLLQDIPSEYMSLKLYQSTTENQIGTYIENGELLKSSIEEDEHGEQYISMIYTGDFQTNYLKWNQRIWIRDQTAYILTFTAVADEYSNFESSMNEVFNSFTLK